MKILQLVSKRQYRGAEVFAATLSEELIKKGLEVLFVGIYTCPEQPLTVHGAVNVDLNGAKKFFSVKLVKSLARFIKVHKPDIIQANGSDTLKYAVIARYFSDSKIPVIYRNISIISSWVGNNHLKRKFYQALFSQVDFITSVGEHAIADLIKLFNYPKNKTAVVRRGIPVINTNGSESRKIITSMFGFNEPVKIVLHAGNFSPEKNHEFLLKVFARIKVMRSDVKLVLVGDGPLFNAIHQRIEEEGLSQTVYLAGFRKDLAVFLNAADLFVLCSKIEGVPGVILEASAQKTPTLAIDTGGIVEVIKDGHTGMIQSGYSEVDFSNSLVQLLSNKNELERMGENAYQFVQENFNAQNNALVFIQLYERLVDSRK